MGYRRFRCRSCKREFNERTGSRFNHLQYPADVVYLVVLWRVRSKLSLRDLPEIFLERGLVFTHETFLKVKRRSVYLYRAIDREGKLVEVLLSEKREKAVAEAFFRSARAVT